MTPATPATRFLPAAVATSPRDDALPRGAFIRVLIACEYSGRVRDAFIARGFDAVSCDLLPTERPGPHIQGDVLEVLQEPWDLVIAHPPCTRLCNSGVRWLAERDLWNDMRAGAAFFLACLNANAPFVAVENPVMHGHAAAIIGKPAFTVQPWQFGDPAKKRTCFWTKGLPPLQPTSTMTAADARADCHLASPGPDRWKERSRTYQGIADAMAEQWGNLIRHSAGSLTPPGSATPSRIGFDDGVPLPPAPDTSAGGDNFAAGERPDA